MVDLRPPQNMRKSVVIGDLQLISGNSTIQISCSLVNPISSNSCLTMQYEGASAALDRSIGCDRLFSRMLGISR